MLAQRLVVMRATREDVHETDLSTRVAFDDLRKIDTVRNEVTNKGVQAVGSTTCEDENKCKKVSYRFCPRPSQRDVQSQTRACER